MKNGSTDRMRDAVHRRVFRVALLTGASALSLAATSTVALAQDEAPVDEIIVDGIRGSLSRAADLKRNADGVVDAITAEDIGKFPDTNLAESLQRITGVSINRVNGEGSLITARGFGADFNLVTLNGRQMPTANIETVGAGDGGDFATGTSRQFDFSNLASEGVRRLEVYKTGRADIATGGIGATVNIVTVRPLDSDGFEASLGAKALHDTTAEFGKDITPEVTGLASWSNDAKSVGVSLFGSYQRRDSGSAGATSNAWNVLRGSEFLGSSSLLRPTSVVTNPPDPDQLVTFPNDSRYIYAADSRERINALATVQFAPTETITLTLDALYAQNKQETERAEQTNWFNRPFDEVTFAGDPVATTVFLFEDIGGIGSPNVKDLGFEQQFRSSEETLSSIGANLKFEPTESLTFSIDGHTSRAWSGPNSRNGTTSTLVAIAAPVVDSHSLDLSSGFPVQRYALNDCTRQNAPGSEFPGTNCNDVLDVGDLGSQIARTNAARQENIINQGRFDARYELDESAYFTLGFDYRDAQVTRNRIQTQQTLGDWGVNNPGDVQLFAPDLVEQYCLSCLYNDFEAGDADIAFRANALDLYDALSSAYAGRGNAVSVTGQDINVVQEKIWAIYGQVGWNAELASRPAKLLMGLRYESTDVEARTDVAVPTAIFWQSDNDFSTSVSGTLLPVTDSGSYNNFLPSVDLSVEIKNDLVARASYSETIARANFGNLFVSDVAQTPPRPTALGGEATGISGNTGLLPLESKNIDLSLEWYFDDASYLSIGFFDKRVRNFIGTGVTTRTLFDLRDPSSGAPGTRSGDALNYLTTNGLDQTDVNLFTLTALIDQFGLGAATTMFEANLNAQGDLDQAFVDATLGAYDVVANSSDPFFQFAVQGPINNREGKIRGVEFAFQHFFGETGFGVQANYTYVSGDVNADVNSDPAIDQFALLGLSDTANASLIYEKYGVSARVSYNWRDKFLAATNDDGSNRNPLFVDAFHEVDANVTYDITSNLQASFEAINIFGEDLKTFARSEQAFVQIQDLGPRYLFGLRYRF